MARFAKIGVGPGLKVDVANLSPEMKQAITDGMADAFAEFATFKKADIETGKVTSANLFGTRKFVNNN